MATAAPHITGASVFNRYVLRRFFQGRARKLATERLTEPLHINLISLFVALFGTFRAKVNFDLIVRQQYAFPMLHAADEARAQGLSRVTVIEFGVAHGAGLLNLCAIAKSVTAATGVSFDVVGFDTGAGMPRAVDYRDHPEVWQEGDFPMDYSRLQSALPPFAQIVIGDVADTIPAFLSKLTPRAPLAFVSIDVDYYSSAKKALAIFASDPEQYLPAVTVYLDDIGFETANPWCGELLAVREFNDQQDLRKIAPFSMLRATRICKNPRWIDMMYTCHILDHPLRGTARRRPAATVLGNEYLRSQ